MTRVQMDHKHRYYKMTSPYGKFFYPLVRIGGFPLMQFKYTRARDAVAHTERNRAKTDLRRARWKDEKYKKTVKARYKVLHREWVKYTELLRAEKEAETTTIFELGDDRDEMIKRIEADIAAKESEDENV